MTDISEVSGKKSIGRAERAKAKILFDAIPKQGELDLELVKKSIYFFSWCDQSTDICESIPSKILHVIVI